MNDETVRAIIDPLPRSGQWNMACDETLLISACEKNVCTLRFYLWEEATLSLGYFQQIEQGQKYEETTGDGRWNELPKVKRLSGGGAILHHHELTYSCCLPATHPLAENPALLYHKIHEQMIAVLQAEGINLSLRGEGKAKRDDPFLCFQRGDANDVMSGSHKVLGSAQRRRRGALLQHGSLLLRKSELATEIPGLFDLVSCEFEPLELASKFVTIIAPILGNHQIEKSLTNDEIKLVNQLIISRYQLLDWSSRKNC